MGFWNSISSVFDSVVSSVKNVASEVWGSVKQVARKVLDSCVTYGEKAIEDVKTLWNAVGPYVKKMIPWITKAADVVASATGWKWINSLAKSIELFLQGLLKLENSPILKEVEDGLRWIINMMKEIKTKYFNDEEMKTAEKYKSALENASEGLTPEQQRCVDMASAINNFMMIQSSIKKLLDSESFKDFEHYLRLRATQKLLRNVTDVFDSATNLSDITEQEHFLLKIGSELISEKPKLSNYDATKLDLIIYKKHKKKLITFVFEELIYAWSKNLNKLEKDLDHCRSVLSASTVEATRLKSLKTSGIELTSEEEKTLNNITDKLIIDEKNYNEIKDEVRSKENIIFASEGYLEILEKSAEELEKEGKGYLAVDGPKVGKIIIDCMEHGKKWNELEQEDRALVIDFANIFRKATNERMMEVEKSMEITVAS